MPGQQNSLRWQINGWSLRTKVAVVLLLPAVAALILGGVRVQSQLDNASLLSTVRDQLGVLQHSVFLTDEAGKEMVTAVSGTPLDGVDLNSRKASVDAHADAIRKSAGFVNLPADVNQTLNQSLGHLAAVRQQTSASSAVGPDGRVAGYLEVINGLSGLVPRVVAGAGQVDLDQAAYAVRLLIALRASLATEEALVRSVTYGAADAATLAAAQHASVEEAVFGEQLFYDIPAANVNALRAATVSTTNRQETLQSAVSGAGTAGLGGMLPAMDAEATALNGLIGDIVNAVSDSVSQRTNVARSNALRDAAIVLGALLAALAIALLVARSLLSPVRRLRSAALAAAHTQLPETVARVRAGEKVDWRTIEPVPVQTEEEIGQLARAFDDMHQQAVRLAGEQAELRLQVSEMFMTLSRRSQSLVELQLEVIEGLESDEEDPQRLDGLFRLDHLATRLRRNGENLQVLAGGSPARRDHGPVSVVELLRAATSEVNDYRRVGLGHAPAGAVRANAAADVVHVLAELLENATRFSPPDRKVVLTADRGADGGLLIEVVDAGLGMAPDDLAAANRRLGAADAVGPETTRRMGLFVVSRLAARHGVTIRLRPTYDTARQSGITASVHLPGALVIADGTPGTAVTPLQRVPGHAIQAAHTVQVPKIPPVALVPDPVSNGASGWFAPEESEADTPEPVGATLGWMSPAQTAWQAADAAVTRQPAGTTAAGLPMRKPGARVIPAGEPNGAPAPEPVGFRDADAIRSNLSRHYNGVRAARERTRTLDGDQSEGAS